MKSPPPVNIVVNASGKGLALLAPSGSVAANQDAITGALLYGGKKHASGGLIPGYAPGRDTVHAMLSPGEFVIVPEAVKALGANYFAGINQRYSKRPGAPVGTGFAAGGPVTAGGAAAVSITAPGGASLKTQAIKDAKDVGDEWARSSAKWFSSAETAVKTQVTDPLTQVAVTTVPAAWNKSVPTWYDAHQATLNAKVATPVTALVNTTIPAAFNATVPNWYNAHAATLNSKVAAPVSTLVNTTIPGAFNATIPTWYNAHAASLNTKVTAPVTTLIDTTIPGAFNATIPKWYDTNPATLAAKVTAPATTLINTTIPAAFSKTIPNWYNANAASFSGKVSGPQTTYFGTTLPSTVATGMNKAITNIIVPVNAVTAGVNTTVLGPVAKAAGITALKIPAIKASTGAVLPGYAPGVDSVHAMLSPGEGILVPEAVRGLGGEDAINAINAKYAGHRGAGKGHASHGPFTTGGTAGGGGGGLTGAADPQAIAALKATGMKVGGLAAGALSTVVDDYWTRIAEPALMKAAGGSIPGDTVTSGASWLKVPIDAWVGAQAGAGGAGGVGTGGITNASGVAALKAAAAKMGWGSGAEWSALNSVEMAEAGVQPDRTQPVRRVRHGPVHQRPKRVRAIWRQLNHLRWPGRRNGQLYKAALG